MRRRGTIWALAVTLTFFTACAAPSTPSDTDPGGLASLSPERENGVHILAKADGWRKSLQDSSGGAYGIVEIADDEVTAVKAWAENVPADLVQRSGEPELPGLYGDLSDIDFDREVLVVYSSGASGTCPGWLTGIEVTEWGTVDLTTAFAGMTITTVDGERVGDCTANYAPYRLVAAIDRGRLPSNSELPTDDVRFDGEQLGGGGLVTTYPADGGT